MSERQREELSARGRERRDEMLESLLQEQKRVGVARRRRRRIAGSVAVIALVSGGAALLLRIPSAPPAAVVDRGEGALVVQTEPGEVQMWIVRTEADDLASATAALEPRVVVEYIDDVELVERLAMAGKTTGVARSGDRVWLTEDVFGQTK